LIEDFIKDNKFDGYASINGRDNNGIDKIFEDISKILYDNYKRKRKKWNKKKILN
jgi:hypothetical protein